MKKLIPYILIVITSMVYSQAGTLDNSFGIKGKLITPVGSGDDEVYSIAIQPNGKILATGYSFNGTDYDFAIVRYNTDGGLDTTFGTKGRQITAIGSGDEKAFSIVLQPNGKFIVVGKVSNGKDDDFALVRYNANGSLDSTFSNDGILTMPIGAGMDLAHSVILQPDGKILVAGYSEQVPDYDFALVRYNVNGTLDNSFGKGGIVTTAFTDTSDDRAKSIALQPDGKIVVAGASAVGKNYDFGLVRYEADGALDKNFGKGGKVTTAIGADMDLANFVGIQTDGKIVAVGYSIVDTGFNFTMVRYNANGSLDKEFGTGGKVITAIGKKWDKAWSAALQPDGKIILAGSSDSDANSDFAMVRYNTDGTLDKNFGTGGKLTTAIGAGDDIPFSIALQTDGKIVLAGTSYNGTNFDFALARYLFNLKIGAVNFSSSDNPPMNYPYPLEQNVNLEYSLNQKETISIQLLDMQGKLIKTFMDKKKQEAGSHNEYIALPDALALGSYLLLISSPSGKMNIKVTR